MRAGLVVLFWPLSQAETIISLQRLRRSGANALHLLSLDGNTAREKNVL